MEAPELKEEVKLIPNEEEFIQVIGANVTEAIAIPCK